MLINKIRKLETKMMIACQMKIRLLRETPYILNLYACVYVGLLTNTLQIFTKEETTA